MELSGALAQKTMAMVIPWESSAINAQCPSHHHVHSWYIYKLIILYIIYYICMYIYYILYILYIPFPVMGGLWHCFTHI